MITVRPYAIVAFAAVCAIFTYILVKKPKFFNSRPAYIGFHTLSLGVFIIYLYESGEYTNDDPNKYAARLGLHISNRVIGICILLMVLTYTVFKTYQVVS